MLITISLVKFYRILIWYNFKNYKQNIIVYLILVTVRRKKEKS